MALKIENYPVTVSGRKKHPAIARWVLAVIKSTGRWTDVSSSTTVGVANFSGWFVKKGSGIPSD
jgi:hypothetical protein